MGSSLGPLLANIIMTDALNDVVLHFLDIERFVRFRSLL